MATRKTGLPRFPELPDHPGRALLDAFQRLLAWRPDDPRLLCWRIFWFPFWVGGDVPAPWLPEHERQMKAGSPAALGAARAIDSIGRRIWINWIIACFARGLWLPFAIGSVIGIVDLLRGNHFAPEHLIWVWAITVPLGLILGSLLRPRRRRVAWMLDHTFNLHDRMTTAVEALETEAPAPGSRASMAYLQLADTANAAIGLRGDPRFRLHPPAREISLAILFGLLLAALLFLRGVGGHIPDVSDTAVPAFVPAADRQTAAEAPPQSPGDTERPPTVQEVQQKADQSQATKEDLNAIAEALDQNAITQPAAEAIRNGDYTAAAQEIRDASANAADLSPEARAALADALDQAAATAQDSSPSLANAASQAADGLREGGDAAKSGMRDLGDAVDLASDAVIPQEQLAQEMTQAQQAAQNQPQGAEAAPNQQASSGQGSSSQQSSQSAQQGQQSQQAASESSSSSGADANPGLSANQQDQQQSSSQSAQNPDSSASGSQPDGSQPGDQNPGAGQPGASDQPGESKSSNPGDSSQASASDSSASDSSQSQPGGESSTNGKPGGSGVGDSSQTPPAEGDSKESTGGPNAKENTPQETPAPTAVSQATAPTGPGTEPTVVPTQSVGLNTENSDGPQVSLGGNNGSSSIGNASGVTEAQGSATQEAVPTAGPDSNRVPEEYRSVVENYFNRGTP